MKICVVSSCGGHLAEVRQLRAAYADQEHFYVINDRIELTADMRDRTYFIAHSERDWRTLLNVWEAWRILRRERPGVVLSTGAGPVVPFAIVARLLGVKVLFVETATRVQRPSLTGRIMYRLADEFLYQWRPLARFFPKARFVGLLF